MTLTHDQIVALVLNAIDAGLTGTVNPKTRPQIADVRSQELKQQLELHHDTQARLKRTLQRVYEVTPVAPVAGSNPDAPSVPASSDGAAETSDGSKPADPAPATPPATPAAGKKKNKPAATTT